MNEYPSVIARPKLRNGQSHHNTFVTVSHYHFVRLFYVLPAAREAIRLKSGRDTKPMGGTLGSSVIFHTVKADL